ncbi:MAG: ribonuclease P protein component [Bacteroidetes bacterium]|nr:ribonuclease P protein component [Bacteroidota bacterium]
MAVFPKSLRKLPPKRQANLHQNGQVIFQYPYKLFYLLRPAPAGAHSGYKIIVSVPKRSFKRAVDRNRIKRQMREAFRLNVSVLNQELITCNAQIDLLCLYLPHEHTPGTILSHKMESLLARLVRLVAQTGSAPDVGVN